MSGGNVTVSLFGRDVSLSKSLAGAAGAAGAAGSKVSEAAGSMRKSFSGAFAGLASTGVFGPLTEAMAQVTDHLDEMGHGTKEVGKTMMATGGIASGLGVMMLGEASKEQSAQAQLSNAIRNTGGSYADYKDQVEHTVTANEKFGYTAVQTKGALTTLVQATHSGKTGLSLMGEAANLATSQHISLDSAARMVARSIGGSTRLFKQYGITMGTSKDKAANLREENAQLARVLSGQASAATDTFSGHMAGMKAHLEDVWGSLSQKLGPALTAVGPAIGGLGAIVESGLVPKLIAGSARLLGFGTASTAAAGEMTAAGTEIEASEEAVAVTSEESGAATTMAFGPIGIAIAALVVAVVLLATHWKTVMNAIRDAAEWVWHALDGIWHGIAGGVSEAWHLIENFIVGTGQRIWGFLTGWVNNIVGTMERWGSDVIGAVSRGIAGAYNAVVSIGGGILGWFAGLPGRILGAIGDLGSLLWNAGASVIHGLVSGVESAIGDVANVFHKITSLIPSWKGPAATDAVLLYNAGQLIMGGLQTGITSKVGALKGTLKGVSDVVAGTPFTGPAVSAPPPAMAGGGAGGAAGGGGQIQVQVPVMLDGRQIALVATPFIRMNLAQLAKTGAVLGFS